LTHLTDCEFAVPADSASHLPLFITIESTIYILLSLSLFEDLILQQHVLHHCIGPIKLILGPIVDTIIFFSTHGRTELMDVLRPMHLQLCLSDLLWLAEFIKYLLISFGYLPMMFSNHVISLIGIHLPPLFFLCNFDIFTDHVSHFSVAVFLDLLHLGILNEHFFIMFLIISQIDGFV